MFPEKYSFQYSKLIKSAQVRKFVSIFTLIILILNFQHQLFAQSKIQIRKVVIDAGHGGFDPGARGKNSKEKDVTLSIALKTGKLIQKNCPGVQVIYTRESDVFIALYRRAQIANENKADLFISIHCNANPSPFPYGTETYVMGLYKSDANLAVAKAENASILLEDNYTKQYDGFDPNSSEAYIIFSMFQNAYLDKSLDFAKRVENSFSANTKLSERGVKQAGFLVLYKTTMPGVLVETGFLSNSKEEAYLLSVAGQDRLAFSIYRAFDEYKRTSDGNIPVVNAAKDSLMRKHPAIIRLQQEKLEKALLADTFGYRNGNKVEQDQVNGVSAQNTAEKVSKSDRKDANNVRSIELIQEMVKVGKGRENEQPGNESNKQVTFSKPSAKSIVPLKVNTGLKFRVQFMTSDKEVPLNGADFKDIPNVKKYTQDQLFKYTAGDEATPGDAERIRQIVAGKGYRDAFVLPFLNENRITMKEALTIIKN
jgi:N-acetylmuramoyl-L-alanine amidase